MDVIGDIVSWTPVEDLKTLSAASPIFDIEIYCLGIRMIYEDNNNMLLYKDDKVIKMPGYNRCTFMGSNKEYTLLSTNVSIDDDISLEEGTYYINKCDKIVLHISWRHNKVTIAKIQDICEFNGITIIKRIDGNAFSIPRNRIARNLYTGLGGIPDFIDSTNKYVVSFKNNYTSFSRFNVLFENGEWIREG